MNRPILADLIALGEGFTTEFKHALPSDLGREICAFANASGGVILIGVDDAGTVIGVQDHNRLKSQVQSVARSADPPVAVAVDSEGDVLRVTVPEQHGKPYSFRGRFFIREGATCQQLSRDEIRDFFFQEGLIRLDETPCNTFDASVEITPVRWAEFARHAGIDPELNPMTVLENLHLVKDARMTHAGAWLLADDITRFTLQAGVTCAVFRGGAKTHILDRKEFHGNLYAIYQEVMAYFQAKLNSALIPNAQGREERLELPVNALREALVNAIAHRDYRSTANVQVYIFHDRLEIVTPGGLPAGMREEDLGSKSVPRNPLLFSMLYRMRLVEQIGSGIRRIHDACRQHGVAEPTIEVSPDWVTVTFPRPVEAATPHVAPHETLHVAPHVGRLIAVLQGEMSRVEIMDALGLKDRQHFARAYLQLCLDAGMVEMTQPDRPRSRTQGYRLTELGRQVRDSLPDTEEDA
jgi:ATP-dependent DNA helicase RecG